MDGRVLVEIVHIISQSCTDFEKKPNPSKADYLGYFNARLGVITVTYMLSPLGKAKISDIEDPVGPDLGHWSDREVPNHLLKP